MENPPPTDSTQRTGNAMVLRALESENGVEMDIAPGRSVWSHDGYAPKGFARDANDVDIVVNATAETVR